MISRESPVSTQDRAVAFTGDMMHIITAASDPRLPETGDKLALYEEYRGKLARACDAHQLCPSDPAIEQLVLLADRLLFRIFLEKSICRPSRL